jgi:SAM-dependent methyltransferase
MVSTTGAMADGRLALAAINPEEDGNPILNMENGRLYLSSYANRVYMLPCDEEERRRLDLMHAFFGVATQRMFSNQINLDRRRVLDLGCGTGIWSIELAPKFPGAQFVGVDIAKIQPTKLPLNLRFYAPVDIESDYSYRATTPTGSGRQNSTVEGWQDSLGPEPWDFIHVRGLKGAITNWPALYARIFAYVSFFVIAILWLTKANLQLSTTRHGRI